jgi:hypothetical protein
MAATIERPQPLVETGVDSAELQAGDVPGHEHMDGELVVR